MKTSNLLLITTLTLGVISSFNCKKEKTTVKEKTELEKLPPITQSGANTFGFLLNGKAWTPIDNYGQPSFKLDVDPTFEKGVFTLSAKRFTEPGIFQSIVMYCDSCKGPGDFLFGNDQKNIAGFTDGITGPQLFSSDSLVGVNGSVSITRYDLVSKIFSGTFNFIIYGKNSTDTFRITDGRFDKRF